MADKNLLSFPVLLKLLSDECPNSFHKFKRIREDVRLGIRRNGKLCQICPSLAISGTPSIT